MSQHFDRRDQHVSGDVGRGVETLRRSPAFRGPGDSPEDHDHANDHLALVYESRKEQFANVIPFIRQGLEQGERCLYVADENSREDVLAAMRAYDIDVDAALDSGALSINTPAETYLRTGEFDRDELLAFWEDSLHAATDENDFTGLRAAAEMTWALDGAEYDLLVEYEAVLNSLYDGEDYTVMCQYNRERFPPEVIQNVIETHPHLVVDNIVSQNFYYTPPEKFFGPEEPDSKVDRMIQTVQERTEAKTELQEQKGYLRELYETTANNDLSFDEKVDQVLDLGRDQFGLDMGFFLKKEGDQFRVLNTRGTDLDAGVATLSACPGQYCKQTVTVDAPVGVEDTAAAGWDDDPLYREYDLGCYIGTKVTDGTGAFGSICFADSSSREQEFTDAEYTFLDLMGQWLSYELEREEREAELRESKEQFERIFESSQDAIYIIDPYEDEILDVNPAGSEMLDYSEEELLSRGPSDLHPHEMDRFQAFVDEVYENGTGFTDELTCRHADGRQIPVELSASRIEYEGRRCMLAIVRDISERKERERELRRSERQFEAVFNNPVSFVGLLDPDGSIRRINENALEFVGIDESEVRGEKFWETPWFDHSEAVRSEIREGIARAADGEYVRAEIPHQSPDGETAIMDSMFEPVHDDDGEVVAIVPSGHDITELRERERFQRRLYEITADPDRTFEEKLPAVLDLGRERFDMEVGGIASVDPSTDRFEVDARNGEHEQLVPGKQYPLSETFCREVENDRVTCGVTDPVDKGYEGKLCYEQFGVRTYLGTYLELDGTDDRTFWFVSTEEREDGFSEAERTFHHLMGQWVKYELERQQYERDLEDTVDQLQQSNDRLKQFAYAASHDLQEPLRMVSSYLQLLEDRYRDSLDEEAQEFIDFAVDGADRMRAMVDDLLAYARVEQSNGEFESVDCDALLERVTNDLQVQIEENDAEIVAESLPTVTADSEQLEQLFSNLVSNAIKYSSDEPPRVEISADRRGEYWEISVDDNGIGMDPEKTDRIFEVFKRLHHDDEYPGTGIGLSLCQEIAENHSGDIWAESEPGEGSTFRFTLRGPETER